MQDASMIIDLRIFNKKSKFEFIGCNERTQDMQATYRIKSREINDTFLNTIRKVFEEDEDLTITVTSENFTKNLNEDAVKKFLEHRKNHPAIKVSKDIDFDSVVDEMNI